MPIVIFILSFAGFVGIVETAKDGSAKEARELAENQFCKVREPAPKCPKRFHERAARQREFLKKNNAWNLMH